MVSLSQITSGENAGDSFEGTTTIYNVCVSQLMSPCPMLNPMELSNTSSSDRLSHEPYLFAELIICVLPVVVVNINRKLASSAISKISTIHLGLQSTKLGIPSEYSMPSFTSMYNLNNIRSAHLFVNLYRGLTQFCRMLSRSPKLVTVYVRSLRFY